MQQINITIGGQNAIIVLPDDYAGARTYYLIVWHHGRGQTETSVLGYPDYLNALLPLGYIFCSSNAHGDDTWGNDPMLNDYTALVAYVRANYSVSHIAFWGASMGGTSALLHTAMGTITGVKGAWLMYPVCNLGAMYPLAFNASINIAYNIPAGGPYATQTAGHDAILRPVSEYAGKRFRFSASPDDTIVGKNTNADPFAAYVAPVALENTILLTSGEHGAETGQTVSDVVAFFERCCRVVDSITLTTNVTLHTPAIIGGAFTLDVPSLPVGIALHSPAVSEGRFFPATLSVTVNAESPTVRGIAPPIARHERQMAVRRAG